MSKYILSVIVASKDPNHYQLNRCLTSFGALKSVGRFQLIFVESNKPAVISKDLLSQFGSVKCLNVPPVGIYSAYNAGLIEAEGKYSLFFGTDDIVLPAMDNIIDILSSDQKKTYDLYAAACYVQMYSRVLYPSKNRKSLILSNWCHQGIFYLTEKLKKTPYNVKYRVQADHAVNILFVSNKSNRIGTSEQVVSYFSQGGVTSTLPDLAFRNDFVNLIALSYGWYFGLLVYFKQKIIDIFSSPLTRFESKMSK